jgi:magnesium chelatase family protein
MEIYGYAPWGYEGDLVRVEVDLHRGIPGMDIVGLPGGAVREARERLKIALRRAGFQFPPDRILVNLSPADLPKAGSGYDLPLALALLAASGQWSPPFSSVLAMGELALDGSLRRVPGILAGAQRCGSVGIQAFAVPEEGAAEARCVAGLPLATGPDLAALVRRLDRLPDPCVPHHQPGDQPGVPAWDLRGQPEAVRALETAAAGGHSLLFYGPPGAGKTLAARSLEALLPPLEPEAALETTRLWSLAGILPRDQGLLTRRPFRAPHHHATAEGLLGGGKSLGPGEISLAHHGVLFLDEAPEFSSRVLQGLREPLEQGAVSVARAGRTAWFPSRFQLVLTANACPCGQTGRERGVCFCSGREVRRYWDRLGTPLMDRVDLRVFLTPGDPDRLLGREDFEPASLVRRIRRARARQVARGQASLAVNATLGPRALERFCALTPGGLRLLAETGRRFDWSSRALHSLLRVARTLADLDDAETVSEAHLEGATALRKPRGEEYWEG